MARDPGPGAGPERPLTDLQINRLQQTAEERWLDGAACRAGRDLDAAADADPVRPRLRASRRSAAVACADIAPAPGDPGDSTGEIPIVGTPSG